MRMPYRRNNLVADRFAERRRRENDAPKLCDQVPTLTSLRLDIEERSIVGVIKHIRRVVIDRAPSLFLVPCGDPRCADGEHDLTSTVMRALFARKTAFHGSKGCTGSLGPSACQRVVHFDGTAEYRGDDI
jgi:hypothetical protein